MNTEKHFVLAHNQKTGASRTRCFDGLGKAMSYIHKSCSVQRQREGWKYWVYYGTMIRNEHNEPIQ